MLARLLDEIDVENVDEWDKIRQLNLIHLAATFLDGSKACCNVINRIWIKNGFVFRTSDVDKLGHTVFDKLMITILKFHTSITPDIVDDGLREEIRFPGEETDICGRWDADSDCVRALLGMGNPRIPYEWKHKFCHTSIQVICHSIYSLAYADSLKDDTSFADVPSGLFVKHCVFCGLKMQLTPLHLVVLTAFNLVEFGANDEDLFGMLAVLLSMLGSTRVRPGPFSGSKCLGVCALSQRRVR